MAAVLITLDTCRECPHHVCEFGGMIICEYNDVSTVRNSTKLPWGDVVVSGCPLEKAPFFR